MKSWKIFMSCNKPVKKLKYFYFTSNQAIIHTAISFTHLCRRPTFSDRFTTLTTLTIQYTQ